MTDPAALISLALVLHNHQPVGNFGWVIAESYDRAYLPMLSALERHPGIRIGLHYTGPLLEWIRAERPEFLDRLRALVARDQVELLGGGYYEPVLASLPERDRIGQLDRMSAEIERIGGRRPVGAWLAERVWEPDLPTSIVDAGYRWTILDDTHFRAASLGDDELWGPYTTEDQGRLLTVFGSDKQLRYGIPFGAVEGMVGHLLANASPSGDRLGFMGDDGEKFGAWPDTYEHCWGAGRWVDRFFDAVEAESGTIATVTPTDWLERRQPIGRIYLPTSSYFEMGEWALPADQVLAFEATAKAAEASRAPWARWLRGGFWRNFQVKYREINDLHKQMLRVSAKTGAMADGPDRARALDHLYQGQSNDCYWHGVFGGIYISHMRLATHEHLIAAEDLADRAAREAGATPDGIVRADTDLDGVDEVLVTRPGQLAVIDPGEGGGLGTWDIRAARHALAAIMRRRPEAYHARLVAAETTGGSAPGASAEESTEPGGGSGSAVATIHDIVRSREPGLAARLHYDAYERRSGLVHLLAPETTPEAFADGTQTELGDAVDGAYEVVSLGTDVVELTRDVNLVGSTDVVRIGKRFSFGGDRARPTLDLDVMLVNHSARPVRFDLAVEWALTMLGGGGNPAAYYRIDDESFSHDSTGRRDEVETVVSGNTFVGIELTTSAEPAARTWWSPIETISNSEYGFERVYQGSALAFLWPVELEPGASRTVAIRNVVTTTVDRTAAELAPG